MSTPGLRRSALALLAVGCGSPEPIAEDPIGEWGCSTHARGELIDAALVRSEAPEIEVGRVAYRVNVPPHRAGYLSLSIEEDADLVVLIDDDAALAAIGSDGAPSEIQAAELDPPCAEAILFTADLALAAGTHVLELGPTTQANVWLAVGSP